MTDIPQFGFGPLHPSATTVRPASDADGFGRQTWFRDASAPDLNNGTTINAAFLNAVIANLVSLCKAGGVAFNNNQGVDTLLTQAVTGVLNATLNSRPASITSVAHNSTLLGAGTAQSPLKVAQGKIKVTTDGSISGDGTVDNPLSVAGLQGALQDAVDDINTQVATAGASATAAAAARDTVLSYVDGGVVKGNFAATQAPAKTDDTTQGYVQGSPWYDGTTGIMWRCVDPATGAARWAQSEAHPGLVSGRLYPIYDGVTGTTVALPAANTLYVVPFKVPALMPVSALRFRVVTGAAGSNIKAGLYANNYVAGSGFARPIGAPIAVCNTATPTATSNADVSCPVTTLMLTPDLIYWAAVKSDGTPTFHAMASTDLTIERLIGRASANGNTCLTGLSIASTFADDLPTLTGAESWTEALSGGLPVVRIA